MPSEPDPELVVRPAGQEDAEGVAALLSTVRAASVPAMPAPVHSPVEDRAWVADQLRADAEVWVAESGGRTTAFLLLEGGWLHSLYVAPEHQRQGIGSTLVELAKALRPGGLGLWVFESNRGARRFYERHGFVTVERTDGAENPEKSPDLHMTWPDPLPHLRSRIDEIDARLATLLAERASVTADIQRHKSVPGPAGRDREREAEIARRMARWAPELGVERIARIMDVVITESLDAAGDHAAGDHAAGDPDDTLNPEPETRP